MPLELSFFRYFVGKGLMKPQNGMILELSILQISEVKNKILYFQDISL
jgi:hypothetical protein